MVSPIVYDDVISVLKQNGFLTKIFIDDVQEVLNMQMSQKRKPSQTSSNLFDYSRYHTIDEVSQNYREF